jgi:hypothetical protein
MTKYYKQLDENSNIILLLTYDFEPNITDSSVVEITEEEYNAFQAESREKRNLVNLLYRGKITINDVPAEWQEEIQNRVNEIIAERGEYKPPAISETKLKAQAYDILTGVSE